MQFSTSAALLAFAAVASAAHGSSSAYDSYSSSSAHSNVTYTTQVVTAYTTYCPTPTKITHGIHTYTVTEATTLTISDCPCTVSVPVYTSSVTSCTTCSYSSDAKPVYPTSIPSVPSSSAVKPSSVIHPVPSSNGTVPSGPVSPPKTPVPSASTSYSPSSRVNGTSPPIATYTGAAAAKMDFMGGIAGAGLMGLVALML
ncbi:hypothetical protein EPUS_08663 [Endocarpon pusillum Z07020]|uniref:Clock-controlled protein 6 n=1 Tax=Endocarpon pusillum (strain Z07020 / HMAS-L-300199) TaxID=1263415 RepID=U1G973_ENDPU|nr:uncharacterized protein EPUS_08663 [Endocarpon pusillum Z07020]ERF68226.1 hypothetical protein EPUS_08663 [Endocarpon pusillum Z07020]